LKQLDDVVGDQALGRRALLTGRAWIET